MRFLDGELECLKCRWSFKLTILRIRRYFTWQIYPLSAFKSSCRWYNHINDIKFKSCSDAYNPHSWMTSAFPSKFFEISGIAQADVMVPWGYPIADVRFTGAPLVSWYHVPRLMCDSVGAPLVSWYHIPRLMYDSVGASRVSWYHVIFDPFW